MAIALSLPVGSHFIHLVISQPASRAGSKSDRQTSYSWLSLSMIAIDSPLFFHN
jgi:hypothetical protein